MTEGWWTISAEEFIAALRRVELGESADLVYAEFYANSRVDRPATDAEREATWIELYGDEVPDTEGETDE